MTLDSTKERVVIASETSYQISYLKTSKVGPKEEKEYYSFPGVMEGPSFAVLLKNIDISWVYLMKM